MTSNEQFVYQMIKENPGTYGVPIRQECSRVWQRDVPIGEVYAILYKLQDDGMIICLRVPGGRDRGYRDKATWEVARPQN